MTKTRHQFICFRIQFDFFFCRTGPLVNNLLRALKRSYTLISESLTLVLLNMFSDSHKMFRQLRICSFIDYVYSYDFSKQKEISRWGHGFVQEFNLFYPAFVPSANVLIIFLQKTFLFRENANICETDFSVLNVLHWLDPIVYITHLVPVALKHYTVLTASCGKYWNTISHK